MQKDRFLTRRRALRIPRGLRGPAATYGVLAGALLATSAAIDSSSLERIAVGTGAMMLSGHALGRITDMAFPAERKGNRVVRALFGSHGDDPFRTTATVAGTTVGLGSASYGLTRLFEQIPGALQGSSEAIGEFASGNWPLASIATLGLTAVQNGRKWGRELPEETPRPQQGGSKHRRAG